MATINMLEETANYLLNHCFVLGGVEDQRAKYLYVQDHLDEVRAVFAPLGYSVSVSYTHLDVYKRQPSQSLTRQIPPFVAARHLPPERGKSFLKGGALGKTGKFSALPRPLPLTDSPGRGRWHEVPEGE